MDVMEIPLFFFDSIDEIDSNYFYLLSLEIWLYSSSG